MVTTEAVKEIALSFDGANEQPHFNRTAFAVNKKIFATISVEERTLNVRLTPQVQMLFCKPGSDVIFPIKNKWGQQGWTTINLKKASTTLVKEVLQNAYTLIKAK
jgi:predicted DNA-binding protein (MmcQ/YjbR family)